MELNFQRTPVTLIIAGVAAALELVCTIDPARREVFYMDLRLGILSTIFAGEVWRPFTTTLLHGFFLHAAFNIWWLLSFGGAIERRFGSYRTLGLIVLLSYVSMLPQFIVDNYNTPINEQQAAVGMSGVIYGLFGIVWIARSRVAEFWEVCPPQVIKLMLAWLPICIVLTYANIMPVANIAHVSGLLFGCLYAMAVYDRRRLLWRPLAVVATLLVLGTMFYCPGHAGYEYHRRLRQRAAVLAPPERMSGRLDRRICGQNQGIGGTASGIGGRETRRAAGSAPGAA
jgi:membrane associated rhomboid family serine protease